MRRRQKHIRRSAAAALVLGVLSLCQVAHAADAGAPGRSENDRGQTVRVAGIVLKWIRTDKEANYRRAELMIREAAAGGAKK